MSTLAADYTDELEATQPLSLDQNEENIVFFNHAVWANLIPWGRDTPRIDLNNDTITLGRNNHSDVTLQGKMISAKHCKIERDESGLCIPIISDLSRNGTYVDGERIVEHGRRVLKDGAIISFPNCDGENIRYIFRIRCDSPLPELDAMYDIMYELGKGGFATVVKGLSKEDGQFYALKIMKMKPSHDLSQQTFIREIAIMKRLRHPNICRLKGEIKGGNYIALVLELVPGGDLFNYLATNGPLSERRANVITFQICDAMAYVHSHGITHRDLKPENILVSTKEKGADPVIKIADFGLAKAVVNHCTMLRTQCGTPAYLAPEVRFLSDDDGYQNVVDSWSVGVIVFYMLTNALPIPEFIPDVKHLVIAWDLLGQYQISWNGENFIRELLQKCPEARMTLTDALEHQWLCTDPGSREMRISNNQVLPIFSQRVSSDVDNSSEATDTDDQSV